MKKPYKVTVVGPRETWTRKDIIDTTSKAKGQWSTGLSPFHLGPVTLYGGHIAKVMENGWQYCKVYPQFVSGGKISKRYIRWAKRGWENPRAVRYPMGKGKKPLFALWGNERLDYVPSRKRIYFHLYIQSVFHTKAFQILRELHSKQDIVLWDYDGYDHRKLSMTLSQVLNEPRKIMGHAFVLAILLEMLDRRAEYKAAEKLPCYYCKKRASSFKPIIFYVKRLIEVSCPKCKNNIRGSNIRRE